jgi:hypothetical protein
MAVWDAQFVHAFMLVAGLHPLGYSRLYFRTPQRRQTLGRLATGREFVEQPGDDFGNLGGGCLGREARPRGGSRSHTSHLAHELGRGGRDLFFGGRWLESPQRRDVSAHESTVGSGVQCQQIFSENRDGNGYETVTFARAS